MRTTRILMFAAAAAVALSGPGCGKKVTPKGPDSGVTGNVEPDAGARVSTPIHADEPPASDISGSDIEGPLKRIFFDFDAYDIRADARPVLERNADWLARNPAESVLIEGHCDERGTEEYNLALGDRRANAARSYLISLGARSGRLTTVTYGKAKPLDPGHDESAWAQNRRAEFRVGGASMR